MIVHFFGSYWGHVQCLTTAFFLFSHLDNPVLIENQIFILLLLLLFNDKNEVGTFPDAFVESYRNQKSSHVQRLKWIFHPRQVVVIQYCQFFGSIGDRPRAGSITGTGVAGLWSNLWATTTIQCYNNYLFF